MCACVYACSRVCVRVRACACVHAHVWFVCFLVPHPLATTECLFVYFESGPVDQMLGPMDQILFEEFLFLALLAILFGRAERFEQFKRGRHEEHVCEIIRPLPVIDRFWVYRLARFCSSVCKLRFRRTVHLDTCTS